MDMLEVHYRPDPHDHWLKFKHFAATVDGSVVFGTVDLYFGACNEGFHVALRVLSCTAHSISFKISALLV